jgi:hypothetical protein
VAQVAKKTYTGTEYEPSSFWISERDGDTLFFPGKRNNDEGYLNTLPIRLVCLTISIVVTCDLFTSKFLVDLYWYMFVE